MKTLVKPEEYVIASRRIAGSHAAKLEQIDSAIQELLDIKTLEPEHRPHRPGLVGRQQDWQLVRSRMDLLYIALTLLFFGAAIAYVAGCDRLGGDRS